VGRLRKSDARKELDSKLLSLASTFVLTEKGVHPPGFLEESIESCDPEIRTLAEMVRESDGEDELWLARKYAGKFAWNQGGRGVADSFASTMDNMLGFEPGLRAPF
jgi:hypothetical protein